MNGTKVILITGASSGIGKCCFDYLNAKGFKAYGTSRKADGSNPNMIKMDVTDRESIQEAVGYVIAKEGQLDVLVNNAGISVVGSAEFSDDSEIKALFDTNFWGVVYTTQAVLPQMRKQGDGLVVNISSLMGLFGIAFQAYYTASKHAVEGYTESLRMELKSHGVKATLIEPGDFKTEISQNRVFVEPITDSPYQVDLDASSKIIVSGEEQGDRPIRIAKLLHKLIHKKKPKVRYAIGKPLDLTAAILKPYLPQKVFEWLIMDHYDMV